MNPKRRPIIAGNWKMNKTTAEARDLATRLAPLVAGVKDRDIVLARPLPRSQAVAEAIKGTNMALRPRTSSGRTRAPLPARFPLKCCWIWAASMLL